MYRVSIIETLLLFIAFIGSKLSFDPSNIVSPLFVYSCWEEIFDEQKIKAIIKISLFIIVQIFLKIGNFICSIKFQILYQKINTLVV